MVATNLRNARLAAEDAFDKAWRGLGAPWRRVAAWGVRTPSRLLISPQDIRTADPTAAADIYSGYFVFAGKAVNTHGRSPFELAPPSPAWAAELASFAWLRHLRAADTALARANARALVDDFLTVGPRNEALPVWEPRVAARRLLSWLAQAPMILADADAEFYRRFMRALARHGGRLRGGFDNAAPGETRLLVCIALATLGLSGADMDALQRRATRMLAKEIAAQIMPDGGHIGRNPGTLVDLLLDLLPLRQVYASRGIAAPQELLNAIDRIFPMLRLLRHGDGSIALFNGMGVTQTHAVATALAYDDALAVAPFSAQHAGYQRLEAGGAVLIMDTGAPPSREVSNEAHAGQLSFEFSANGQIVICNCGAPDNTRPDLRQLARATAAHSTLTLADASSSRFSPVTGAARGLDGRITSGPRKVEATRHESPAGPGLLATHDGYAREFGFVHERALRLSADGNRLVGADRLLPTTSRKRPPRATPYALRFHLHPTTRATAAADGMSATLILSNGDSWKFAADGLPVGVEASISFAGAGGPRAALQIVVQSTVETPAINWSLEKL